MQANLNSVKARRVMIARQVDELRAEDEELASVETILARLAGGGARAPQKRGRKPGRPAAKARKANGKANGAAKASKKTRGRRSESGSQRELVLATLKKSGAGWMDVKQIIASVKSAHGVSIPPRSLSPLLSNMKKAGVIQRQGRRVAAPGTARAR
jgi:hypothetical protein